jgi:hypothetical protein
MSMGSSVLNKKIKWVKFTYDIIIKIKLRNRQKITSHRRNPLNITKMELTIRMTSDERCLANMRDGHTCTIGGVNLVVPIVGLVGGELAELTRQVIRGASVHVPGGINRV